VFTFLYARGNILEHTNVKCYLCTKAIPHNTIDNTRAELLVSVVERQVS
jgi:hypothetical protein